MNKKAWVVTGAFLAALAFGTGANLLTPEKTFSQTENRVLQTFPPFSLEELTSGRFTTTFDTYTTDQFWNRDGWVGLKTMTQLALLNKDNGRAYFGRDGFLFEKTDPYSETLVANNVAAVARFVERAKQAAPGLRARVMLVPTAAAILPEKLPPLAPVPDQAAVIAQMKAAVKETVDPTALLKARRDEGLFYRTDHHWTTAGAYAGYTALMESLGEPPLPRDAFTVERVTEEFFGTVYSKANLYTVKPDFIEVYRSKAANPCTVTWKNGRLDGLYDPAYLDKKDKYAYFLGGNHPLTTVETGTANGRTLLLIKDSYANALVPFLAAHYQTIVLVDPRYYKTDLSALFQEKQVTDLLVLYNVNGFGEEKTVAAVLPQLLK